MMRRREFGQKLGGTVISAGLVGPATASTRRQFIKQAETATATLGLLTGCKRLDLANQIDVDPDAIKKFGASLKGRIILPTDLTESGRPLQREVSRRLSQQTPLSADPDRMHRADWAKSERLAGQLHSRDALRECAVFERALKNELSHTLQRIKPVRLRRFRLGYSPSDGRPISTKRAGLRGNHDLELND